MTNDNPSNVFPNSKYIRWKCLCCFKLDDKCKFLKLGLPAFKYSVKFKKNDFSFVPFQLSQEH